MNEYRPGIVLVPHTHWDREWYEPFQVFRHRLVTAMDRVLAMAASDPQFRFTLDGQTQAIDDYLEIRPEREHDVRTAVANGQLALGPWLILLDEFLSGGETIVRNLRMGWQGAERLGHAMTVGYLPDMFGHVAQMPQLLRRAGIQHTAFWRGVPGTVSEHAFTWESPDGSRVRAEYLFDGYGNALDIVLVPALIPDALRAYSSLTAERWTGDPILGMLGTDHSAPHADTMEWVRNHDSEEFPITMATLEEYVALVASSGPSEIVRGELRSHARGNILPGVLSIRRGLKDAMVIAERTAREAELLLALNPVEGEHVYLDLAWRRIIQSSAHDSVVGSGTDETVEQVGARLAEASHILRAARDGVLDAHADLTPSDGFIVANTLPRTRTLHVEVEAPAPSGGEFLAAWDSRGARLPVQQSGDSDDLVADEMWPAAEVERVLRRIHRRELFGREIDRYELSPGELIFHLAEVPGDQPFDLLGLRSALIELASLHPAPWRVTTVAERRRAAVIALPVSPTGLDSFRLGTAPDPHPWVGVVAEESKLRNGLLEVTVNGNGTVDLVAADGTALRGVGRLVDEGDRGDSYNFGPVARGLVVDAPIAVRTTLVDQGPLRARIRVERDMMLPASLGSDPDERSARLELTTVVTHVELRHDEPYVRLTVEFTNHSSDHRLRLHIPVGPPATTSAAEGQFAVVERGLTAEGGWGEFPLPTFPASSFVQASNVAALLSSTAEYELVSDGAELAVTLVRAVGSISVNLHPLRDEPAASEIPIPGAQELGNRHEVGLAIMPVAGGWRHTGVVAHAESFRAPALVRRGRAGRGSSLPVAQHGVEIAGQNVQVTAILPHAEGGVEVRMVALDPEGATVVLTRSGMREVVEVDLLGRTGVTTACSGRWETRLEPWEIRSVVLR